MKKKVDLDDLEDCGRWLMLMVSYFNGARRQDASLLKNIHVLEKQRARTDEELIRLDNEALELNDVACLIVDSHSYGDDGGKTGRVELALPRNLSDALVNYMTAKDGGMGCQSPDAPLFVSKEGDPIGARSLYLSNAAKGVFAEMGFRVTATQNRSVVATVMRAKDLKGEMFTVFFRIDEFINMLPFI